VDFLSATKTVKVDGLYSKLEIFQGHYIEGKISSGIIPLDRKSNFLLPGRGTYKDECGEIRAIYRCQDTGTLTSHSYSCDSKDCPICYTKWSSKRAKSILWRIRAYTHFKTKTDGWYHWILSPGSYSFDTTTPNAEYIQMVALRNQIKLYFREGIIIFHPYRLKTFNKLTGRYVGKKEAEKLDDYSRGAKKWIYGPHYHILTQQEPSNFHASWIKSQGYFSMVKYKNNYFSVYHPELKDCRDIKQLLNYELTHYGLFGQSQAYIYSGEIHPSRFKTRDLEFLSPKVCTCKLCKKRHYSVRSRCSNVFFKTLSDEISKNRNYVEREYKIDVRDDPNNDNHFLVAQDENTVYTYTIPIEITDKDKIVRYLSHFFPNFVIEQLEIDLDPPEKDTWIPDSHDISYYYDKIDDISINFS
jgi:hypothetical protein